jgi:hypothetical protein
MRPSIDYWQEPVTSPHSTEVRVRRHNGGPECDVVIHFRGKEIIIRCRDCEQAAKWARIECKAYRVADGFIVER